MAEFTNIFEMLGGLSLVLYGIHISTTNFQKILGSRLEEALKKTSGNPLKGFAIGTAITGVIHSSATTAMILIGLISGGLLNLESAIPTMLGANIGSTIVVQLASLQIGSGSLLLLTLGVLIHITAQKKIYKRIGEAVIGFSFLFMGAGFLFSGASILTENQVFLHCINFLVGSPVGAAITGAFITFILQSASAASIFVMALGIASVISLPSALFLILGINFGSSLKVINLVLKEHNFSGKLALIHFMFNLLGLVIFSLFFSYFYRLVEMSSPDIARQIANAHTLYNLISAVIFLPLVPASAKLAERLLPAKKYSSNEKPFYLDRKLICTPSVSLAEVNRGVVMMAKISRDMLESSKEIFFAGKSDNLKQIEAYESEIDEMTEKISEYTIQISQQNLSDSDKLKLYSLMHIFADIERLCDHIWEMSLVFAKIEPDDGIQFSEKAKKELTAVFGKLKIMQNLVIKSLDENNPKLAGEITRHENKVDEIIKKISANSESRVEAGTCSTPAAKRYAEILYNLERIGDHYDNIAYAVTDRFRHEERS